MMVLCGGGAEFLGEGHLREFQEKRSVLAFKIRLVEDPVEMEYHKVSKRLLSCWRKKTHPILLPDSCNVRAPV